MNVYQELFAAFYVINKKVGIEYAFLWALNVLAVATTFQMIIEGRPVNPDFYARIKHQIDYYKNQGES